MKSAEQIAREILDDPRLTGLDAEGLIRAGVIEGRKDHVWRPIITVSADGASESEGVTVYDIGFLATAEGGYSQENIDEMVEDFRRVGWNELADEVLAWWASMNADPPVRAVIFQQGARSDHSTPWPVVIDGEGDIVHGRPDAEHLVGVVDANRVLKFTVEEILEDPSVAVGWFPLFASSAGFFSVQHRIDSCDPYTGDLDSLRESERGLRKASQS